MTLQATGEVLALDPGTFHVTVTGRVMRFGNGFLLAERGVAVNAPVPAHWRGYKAKPRLTPAQREAVRRGGEPPADVNQEGS